MCGHPFSSRAFYAEYIPMPIPGTHGRVAIAALGAAAAAVATLPANAGGPIAGPVEARIVRVVDGDTIEVTADIWLGLAVHSLVRLRGIDAPELRGRCSEERALASAARDRLAILAGDAVRLVNVEADKFGGRVVADVSRRDGTDVGEAMVASGLARPYHGAARQSWCPAAAK